LSTTRLKWLVAHVYILRLGAESMQFAIDLPPLWSVQ